MNPTLPVGKVSPADRRHVTLPLFDGVTLLYDPSGPRRPDAPVLKRPPPACGLGPNPKGRLGYVWFTCYSDFMRMVWPFHQTPDQPITYADGKHTNPLPRITRVDLATGNVRITGTYGASHVCIVDTPERPLRRGRFASPYIPVGSVVLP